MCGISATSQLAVDQFPGAVAFSFVRPFVAPGVGFVEGES